SLIRTYARAGPGSAVRRAGIGLGDIILALDGVTVSGADDLIRLLAGEQDRTQRGSEDVAQRQPSHRVARAPQSASTATNYSSGSSGNGAATTGGLLARSAASHFGPNSASTIAP